MEYVKSLLLDLDDTLLDYSSGVDDCWATACTLGCADGGIETSALIAAVAARRRSFWDNAEHNRRERVNMLAAWTKIVAQALETLGRPDPARASTIATEFARRRHEGMQLFPDALTGLAAWRAAGIGLGLVTNGDTSQQRDKIERHGLASYFEVIVIEGEFGIGKPEAAVYRHALQVLGARAEDTCMVGDHLDFDVAGAQRLGVQGVWIDRAGAGLPDRCVVRPDRIIRSLSELGPGLRSSIQR